MADFPPKQNGRCLRCHADCYDILVQFAAGHPRAGEPRQLGAMAPWGRQVCFLLTDGSEMAITFCRDCAEGMVPEDYYDVMRACQRAEEASTPGTQTLRGKMIVAKRCVRKEAAEWQGSGTRLVLADAS